MKKTLFKVISRINKWVLPKYSRRNPDKLSSLDKAIIAFRYWVTKNSLD